MKKTVFTVVLGLASAAISNAQIGSLCDQAAPACAQTGLTYPNSTGVTGLGSINCLGSSPNPSFYYLQVDDAGNIDMTLNQTGSGGGGLDVDFMLWGPFSSVSAGCASISNNPAASNADCSFSASATESVNVTNGTPGAFYILLITNYSNQPGTVNIIQTGGAGSTNCGILSNAQNSGPICMGEVLLLEGDASVAGGSTATINWYLAGNYGTSLSSSASFAFSPPAPGSYDFAFVVTDNNTFESDTSYTTAVVNPIPAAPTFTSTAPACQGSTVMLTPTNIIAGATYSWSGTNGFTSNQPTVTFANANPTIFNADYTLTVTVNGCTSPPYTQSLVVYPTTVPVVTGPTEVCEGQTVPLQVSNEASFVTFAWNGVQGTNPQQEPAGSYTVTATDVNGCQTTSTPAHVISLIANPLDITGPDSFCEGSPVTLSATAGKQSYAWSTGSATETTEVSVDGPVVVHVVSQEGCQRSDTLQVKMYDKPVAAIAPAQVCNTTPVSFQNNTQVSDNYGSAQQSWAWSFGHLGPDSLPAISTESQPSHQFPGAGTYNVTFLVTTSNGCTDQVTMDFKVIQEPEVGFVFESLCFAEGKFINTTQKGSYGYQSMAWNFGDGTGTSASMDSVIYYGYPEISTYTVTLTVTDSANCVGTLTQDITLKETPVFEDIPNIITPNGDNVNDDYTFLPVYQDCFNYTFAVFNRWGAKVFETENSNKGFAGISGLGSKLQDGVYFWVLIANGIGQGEGEQVLKKGTLTVAASGTK